MIQAVGCYGMGKGQGSDKYKARYDKSGVYLLGLEIKCTANFEPKNCRHAVAMKELTKKEHVPCLIEVAKSRLKRSIYTL